MEDRRFFELDARLGELNQRRQGEDPRITSALQAELELGWIYHDNALEGVVLSRNEIQSALAGQSRPDSWERALDDGIRGHKVALDFVVGLGRTQAAQPHKRGLINVQLLRQLHELFTPQDVSRGSPYRAGSPPHRAYHHAIASADKIPARMRKLCESLDEAPSQHPVAWVANVHFELMSIYPWAQNNGKVARLLMNLLLLCDGYPPAVISGLERQRYYESLCGENDRLAGLIVDALNNYYTHTSQFYDALRALRPA